MELNKIIKVKTTNNDNYKRDLENGKLCSIDLFINDIDNNKLEKDIYNISNGSMGISGAIGGVLFFVSIIVGIAMANWWVIVIGIALSMVLLSIGASKDKKEDSSYLPKFEDYINNIADKYEENFDNFLKENNINKKDIQDIVLLRTNIADYENEIIQCYINSKEIVFFNLPIKLLTVNFNMKNYYIPYWNSDINIYIERFKEKDIEHYTYFGSEVNEVSGNGVNLGGALLGGFLFGGVGAIIGSQEEINSKINDLREVQITFKNNKMINIKGINLFKDLLCYFPNKELNTKKK